MMGSSKPVVIVAIILMLVFVLPSLCFGLLAGTVALSEDSVPKRCHGGYSPMPNPVHSCCYAPHHIPAVCPSTARSVAAASLTEWVTAPMDTQPQSAITLAIDGNDSSPPSPLVLRI